MAGTSKTGDTILSDLAYSLGAPEPALRLLVSILLGNVRVQLCHVGLFIFTCKVYVSCKQNFLT
jgi:hypothetical protein